MLEVFSYIFFYPTALIGPSIEFKHFINFIRLENEYASIDYTKCTLAGLEEFAYGVILSLSIVFFSKRTDGAYCATEEFAQQSLIYKIGYSFISVQIVKFKYYVGWKLTQGALNLSGMPYTVKQVQTSEGKQAEVICFDKLQNCVLKKLELSINLGTRIHYWNRSVHLWLKYYIFLRILKVKAKPFNKNTSLTAFVTFVISALWHGFFINYYLFFLHAFLLESVDKYLEKKYRLFTVLEEESNILVRAFGWAAFMTFLSYFGVCFGIYSLEENLKYYKSFYFVPNILIYLAFFYVNLGGLTRKTKKIS